MIHRTPPRNPDISGRCQLCGEISKKLEHVATWDFVGWLCPQCMDIVVHGNKEKHRLLSEWTEPGE